MDAGPEIQRWQDTVLDSHDAPSEKSPLASLFAACSELFALLIHSLSQETPQSLLCELQRSHDRLVLWADAYGIEEGNFEGKLKMSQRVGDFTLETLKSMRRALTHRLLPLVEQHGPRATECSLKAADLSILAEKLSMLVQGDDSSDYSSSEESSDGGTEDNDDGLAHLEKLREVTEDLTMDTECLLDLGTRFDEQVVNPLVNEEAVDPQTVDGWDPSGHFVERIRRLYPSCDDDLAERLGKANWERVLKFQEGKEKNAPESVAIATTLSTFADPVHVLQEPKDTTSLFHDSGVGTSIRSRNRQARSRYTASLTTQGGWNNNALKIPELSAQAKLGHEFSCIACGERLRIQEEANWNFHIITDLQPYMCLEAGCESLIFLSKWSWTRHLERSHGSLDNWAAMMCRFCHKPVPSGMDNIVEHLADHLEKISVMAIPTDQSAEPLHAVAPTLSYLTLESHPPSQQRESTLPPKRSRTDFVPVTDGDNVESPPTIRPISSAAPAIDAPKVMARVVYDFSGQKENELSVRSGQIIVIVEKGTNGWWLAKSGQDQGWVPSTYVEEIDSASVLQLQAQTQASQQFMFHQAQARLQAQGMQGQPGGYVGPGPPPQNTAMSTLSTPIQRPNMPMPQQMPQRPTVQMAQQLSHQMAPQMNHGPGADLCLDQENPSPQAGEVSSRSELIAAAMRRLPPHQQQVIAQFPPEVRNELLNRLLRQLPGLGTGPVISPNAMRLIGTAPNPSPASTKSVPSDLPPGVSPVGSARNQRPEITNIHTKAESDGHDGVAIEVPGVKNPEGWTSRHFSSRHSSHTPELIDLDAHYADTEPTFGDSSSAGANSPWLPLFPQDTSEMPPPPSSNNTSVRGNQVGDNTFLQQQHAAMVKGKEVEESPEVSLPFIGYSFKRFGPDRSMESEVAAFSSSNKPKESSLSSVPTASTSAPSGVNSRRRDKPLPPIIIDDPSDTNAIKRARNTLAARKARERKAQRLDELEQKIAALEAERNHWKEAFLAKGQDEPQEQDSTIASADDRHG